MGGQFLPLWGGVDEIVCVCVVAGGHSDPLGGLLWLWAKHPVKRSPSGGAFHRMINARTFLFQACLEAAQSSLVNNGGADQ